MDLRGDVIVHFYFDKTKNCTLVIDEDGIYHFNIFDSIKIDEIDKSVKSISIDFELDGERVLEIAKEKGELVKEKVDELAVQAKEKATPAIEKTISDVRERVIEFLKNTTKKLEKQRKEAKDSKK